MVIHHIDPDDGDQAYLWNVGFLVQQCNGQSPKKILAHLFTSKASNFT
jgi:hypothetical protein